MVTTYNTLTGEVEQVSGFDQPLTDDESQAIEDTSSGQGSGSTTGTVDTSTSDPVDDTNSGNTDEGLADDLAGSVDESIARQFDDEPGGGFADEAGAVADPTKSANPGTERDVQAAGLVTGPVGFAYGAASVATGAGQSPEAESAGGQTTHRPKSPVDQAFGAGETTAENVQESVPNVEVPELPEVPSVPPWADEAAIGAVGLVVIGVFLWLLGPFAEAFAASQGG